MTGVSGYDQNYLPQPERSGSRTNNDVAYVAIQLAQSVIDNSMNVSMAN